MNISAQELVNEFKNKVISSTYHPDDPIETFKARFAAALLLNSKDPDDKKQADMFIKKTSGNKETSVSFLETWASEIKECRYLQICSTYHNVEGYFLEFKCFFLSLDGKNSTLHLHTQYQIRNNLCFFIAQNRPMIRVIGDPVLHTPGIPFPATPTTQEQIELDRQIEIAKSVLIKTGGAGIAANQCAEIEKPYCFTIVGIFYESKKHVQAVNQRYPNAQFPAAKIMVNPVINHWSNESQAFNHACLSVPCVNRCAVLSPKEISVTFNDASESMLLKNLSYKGIDAVVLWHELTHILLGKTYIDVTLSNLSTKDLTLFQKMIDKELNDRRCSIGKTNIPDLTTLPFHFSVKIDHSGNSYLDLYELAKVLPNVTEETLTGLLNQASRIS